MTSFQQKKKQILEALNVSSTDYTDLSPKGSVDEGIVKLIGVVNAIPGLVTTSSCAGRVSVYVEGKKKNAEASTDNKAIAGTGGKGGGRWIFVSHDPINLNDEEWSISSLDKFGLHKASHETIPAQSSLIHIKFEPMILHVLCASLHDASAVLTAAFEAGFRESGAMNLATDDGGLIVGVRSNGLSFDCIVGHQAVDGELLCIVDDEYIKGMLGIANERFFTNSERTQRFEAAINRKFNALSSKEDSETRRQRKRAEGLAKQQALQATRSEQQQEQQEQE